jgi:hypothetical protein
MYILIHKVGVNRHGHLNGGCWRLEIIDNPTLKKSLGHPFWQPWWRPSNSSLQFGLWMVRGRLLLHLSACCMWCFTIHRGGRIKAQLGLVLKPACDCFCTHPCSEYKFLQFSHTCKSFIRFWELGHGPFLCVRIGTYTVSLQNWIKTSTFMRIFFPMSLDSSPLD